MVRSPSVDKIGLKRGAWSEEEDNKLRAYIKRYGHWNWRLLPKFAGLARCGKSCRLRWLNYLKPGLKKGSLSKEEEEMIIKLHEEIGNKWSSIAAKLPGRTDNEIKNFWNSHVRKCMKKDPKAMGKTNEKSQNMHDVMDENEKESTDEQMENGIAATDNTSSTEPFSQNIEEDWIISENGISLDDESFENFWMEPILSNTSSKNFISPSQSSNSSITNPKESSSNDDFFSSCTTSSVTNSDEDLWSFWNEPFSLDTSYNQSIHDQLPPVEEGHPFTSFLDYDADDLFNLF
ncbi:hypothetical protein M9H77_20063 [Catharanthus roseus]|uniref:Uncharacterized protein n=1 Tax=Catharanthus roseus TaxID=4058 RepID=A0ACC0AKE8_CATRO|nr:hypothetical protein M9H77_20063 [Catharanthus roseus]